MSIARRRCGVACLGLDELAATPASAQDEKLGRMIEDLRTLGANRVVIAANAALPAIGAPVESVYFPSSRLPMRADLLSRVTWQVRSWAGAEVYLYLPGQPPPRPDGRDGASGIWPTASCSSAPAIAGTRGRHRPGRAQAQATGPEPGDARSRRARRC